MRNRLKFLIIFAAALLVAGVFTATVALRVATPVPKVITSGAAAIGGPFTLVGTNGEEVSDQTYRGKWLLIFFGYTYCPDACPTTLNNISVALEKLGSDAAKLQPLFVTVDPHRDTREVIKDYLQSFDSRIIGLTGTQDQIDRVAKEYRVFAAQQKSESEDANDYLVSHSAYIYLMDPHGKFVNVIEGGEAGEHIAAWLHKEMSNS